MVNSTNVAQDFKYNGVEFEESLGLDLYEMAIRSYDPAIGRFTGIDPITHYSMSTYTAFDNNPVFWSDPSGADSWTYVSGGTYRNNQTGEETTDWRRAVNETQEHLEYNNTFHNKERNIFVTINNPMDIGSNTFLKGSGELSIGPQSKDGGTFFGFGDKADIGITSNVATIEVLATLDKTVINITATTDLQALMLSTTLTVDVNYEAVGAFIEADVEGNVDIGGNLGPIKGRGGDGGEAFAFKIVEGNTSFINIGVVDMIGLSGSVELVSEAKQRPNYSVRKRVRQRELERIRQQREKKKKNGN